MNPKIAPNPFVLPDLGQVDPRALGATALVRWLDWAVEERPYSSPDDEYVRSPYPVSAEILRDRWTGLFDERDLKMWSETPQLRAKRFEYQDKVAAEALSHSFAGDTNYIARRIDREIVDLSHLIERLNIEIASGYEYKPVKGASAGPLSYNKMPMTPDSLRKLVSARVQASQRLSELLGLATKIIKVDITVEQPLHASLAQFLEANDPEYAALQRLVEGDLLPHGALTAGDGEALEAARRKQYDNGRVIDSVPLPRLERDV